MDSCNCFRLELAKSVIACRASLSACANNNGQLNRPNSRQVQTTVAADFFGIESWRRMFCLFFAVIFKHILSYSHSFYIMSALETGFGLTL